MYWLLSLLILVLMMAILAVTGDSMLPLPPLSEALTDVILWPLLVIMATILLAISQRRVVPVVPNDNINLQAGKQLNETGNKQTVLSKPSPQYSLLSQSLSGVLYYSLMALLVLLLLVGGGLQALQSHSQAEDAKVTNAMRVQALVTIEGISDSVYDPTSDSGYRQVATISYIAPLVTELSAKDLDRFTFEQVQESSKEYSDRTQNNRPSVLKHRILLNAYPKKTTKFSNLESLNTLQPGDQVLMSMSLAPLASSQQAINNPTGFDSYRWLRARHIDGVATILSVGNSNYNLDSVDSAATTLKDLSATDSYLKRLRTRIDQGRWQLRQSFHQDWSSLSSDQQQARAVTLSLLTGDRSLINRETKDLYQLAGISHLLAISGTHVLFLAIIMAAFAILIFDRFFPTLYRYVARWQVRWGVMISAAFIYALFTGFDVPAARTAWMLLAIGAVRLTLLPVSTMRVLLALAVIMAWVDPYVLWQAGYWLSFVAVALILKYDASLADKDSQHSHSQNKDQTSGKHNQPQSLIHSKFAKAYIMFKRLFKLQCWLFLALLPITLMLFGKASLWGLIINLFAIGLFGWVIVPLNLLAGLCYLVAPSVAKSLWALVSSLVASLHELLFWLTDMPALSKAWLYTPVNSAILLMAVLILIPWLLPRGLLSRGLALPPLSLLIMTVYANQQAMTLNPTLYVLPINDSYISAAVLQYPIDTNNLDSKNKADNDDQSISWLVLADHRPKDTRTMVSALSADKITAILEQQLGTLAIKRLEGIIVQTSVIKTLEDKTETNFKAEQTSIAVLAQTAKQLSKRLPTKHYWQAGKIDRAVSDLDNGQTFISAQDCTAGKAWQSANKELSIQALTGWSMIDDTSVWDCSLSIDSAKPIRVLQYNAADPLRSPALSSKSLTEAVNNTNSSINPTTLITNQVESTQSRLILDASTHQRLWQLWSLLCAADAPLTSASNNSQSSDTTMSTTWLAHSTSKVPSTVLAAQQAQHILSYDSKGLETAFALDKSVDESDRKSIGEKSQTVE